MNPSAPPPPGGPPTRRLTSAAALAAGLTLLCVAAAALLARPPWNGPHIHRGREREVMHLVAPLLGGALRGARVEGVQIISDEVRVQLARRPGDVDCALPKGARPPGMIVVTRAAGQACPLALSTHLCAEASEAERRRLLDALCARDRGDVWTVSPPFSARVGYGLLTPWMRLTRLGPASVAAVCFALALLASLAAARAARGPAAATARPDRRAPWLAAALSLAVGAATVQAGASLPLDGDEGWAQPVSTPILDDDHDAWVHPPVFRALQQGYAHAVGLSTTDRPLAWRGLSVACAALAWCALALSHAARARRAWTLLALLLPALAPGVMGDAVRARPYALATLLVALAAATSAALRDGAGDRATRWFVLVVSAGLAAWTDLVAGLFALPFVAAAWLDPTALPPSPARARGLVALALAAWCVALVPGALAATRTQVHPTAAPGVAAPDLRASAGLGRHGPRALALSLTRFGALGRPDDRGGFLGALALVALCALAWRAGRRAEVIALAAVYATAWTLGLRLGLRTRNVLPLPYLTAWVLARAADRAGGAAARAR